MAATKEPAAKPEDAMWQHITDLHRKIADIAVQAAGREKEDPMQAAMIAMAVTQAMQSFFAPLMALMQETKDVLEVLASPRIRTGRVNLPEGPVEMTITEAHEKRKEH